MAGGTGPRVNPDSIMRKFTMWWFREPWGIAYVSINGVVDMTHALAYLDKLSKQGGEKVTVQHLLAGVVGRALHHHPAANARIINQRVVAVEEVGLAMPVNLLGQPGGSVSELGMAVVEDVHRKSLRDIGKATRGAVGEERSGKSSNPLISLVKKMAKRLPQRALDSALDAMHHSLQNPALARAFYQQIPITSGLTNPGAAVAGVKGARFTGGAFSLPQRLLHVGTVWGVSMIADDVMVEDGKVVVRPCLPVLLIFDHRLIDGVAAGRLLSFAVEVLQNPERWFGPDGSHEGPHPWAPESAS